MTGKRLHIIAEGLVDLETAIFLDEHLKVYEWNKEVPFMNSPALSLRNNEAYKFKQYTQLLSSSAVLSLLSTLDDANSDAKELLELLVADEPRLHIVAQYKDAHFTSYFLDSTFSVFLQLSTAHNPYSPSADPTFFNLKSYFKPIQLRDKDIFLNSFFPWEESYKKQFEQEQFAKRKEREEQYAHFAYQAAHTSTDLNFNLLKKRLKELLSRDAVILPNAVFSLFPDTSAKINLTLQSEKTRRSLPLYDSRNNHLTFHSPKRKFLPYQYRSA